MTHHFAGLKVFGMTTALTLFAVDTVIDSPDLVARSLREGGLLSVVLVLFYFYRRDFLNERANGRDRISVLTDLVQQATAAQTKSADAQMMQASAIADMTRTIAHITGRS